MTKRNPGTHHVVPSSNGGWDIRRGGADRASAHFDRKSDAVERAQRGKRGMWATCAVPAT